MSGLLVVVMMIGGQSGAEDVGRGLAFGLMMRQCWKCWVDLERDTHKIIGL